jgi:hypothetical protein
MLSTVSPLASGGAEVLVSADIDLVGKIVQFGRGMIEEVSRQMFRQFSTCVKQQLEIADEPPAAGESQSAGDAQPESAPQPAQSTETKAVAAAPLAFRALWAIVARFFRRLFGSDRG